MTIQNEGSGLLGGQVSIQHIAGVIDHDDIERLKRLIFRSTKGKSYVFMRDYVDDVQVGRHAKSVYIVVFWDGKNIRDKIQKICDSFSGNRYELPEFSSIPNKIQEIENSIQSASNVYNSTRRLLRDLLINFEKVSDDDYNRQQGKASTIYIYKMFLAQEKALYQNLNMMKRQNNILIGYFWAPLEYENKIRGALQNQTATKMVIAQNHNIPEPTFFKKNEFSHPW